MLPITPDRSCCLFNKMEFFSDFSSLLYNHRKTYVNLKLFWSNRESQSVMCGQIFCCFEKHCSLSHVFAPGPAHQPRVRERVVHVDRGSILPILWRKCASAQKLVQRLPFSFTNRIVPNSTRIKNLKLCPCAPHSM
jgi:hypothetical protein